MDYIDRNINSGLEKCEDLSDLAAYKVLAWDPVQWRPAELWGGGKEACGFWLVEEEGGVLERGRELGSNALYWPGLQSLDGGQGNKMRKSASYREN